MRANELDAILRRQPFQPFRMFLSNGMSYDVRHPEMALVTKNAVLVGISPPESSSKVYEEFAIVTLLHINSIEPLPVGTPPSANGPPAHSP